MPIKNRDRNRDTEITFLNPLTLPGITQSVVQIISLRFRKLAGFGASNRWMLNCHSTDANLKTDDQCDFSKPVYPFYF